MPRVGRRGVSALDPYGAPGVGPVDDHVRNATDGKNRARFEGHGLRKPPDTCPDPGDVPLGEFTRAGEGRPLGHGEDDVSRCRANAQSKSFRAHDTSQADANGLVACMQIQRRNQWIGAAQTAWHVDRSNFGWNEPNLS